MLIRTCTRSALILACAVSLSTAVTGCAGNKNDPLTADHIKPAPMPEGGEWHGVYYNQLYGFLHLTENSGAVQGAWRTTAGDKWGELYGETDGNLFRYTWMEHKVGVVGPNATTEGKGYFVYTVPNPDEPHVIAGEWGLGEAEAGHTWDGLKQLNMEPDPKSVRPDELEGQIDASSWDQETPPAADSESEEETEEPEEE